MKLARISAWGNLFAGALCVNPVIAQMDPVFTYQGQLKELGHPYNGVVYLEFGLWDDPDGGAPVGWCCWTPDGVDVVDGLFTVEVDAMAFGPEAFNGQPRWLEVAVTDEEGMSSVELSPRQPINPAPYALYAFDGPGGSGDSVWEDWGTHIYYTTGNVGIGEIEPSAMLDVYGTVEMTGFQLTDQPVAGYVLTSDGSGCGSWQPPAGGGDSLWQIGESCILYNGGDVGIGLDEFMWPAAKLEVGGTVKMDGLRLGESATSGYVLTADSAGVGTWQPAGGGGDSLWTSDNEGIHYEDDTPHRSNVGIGGPADASARLYVESDGLKAIHAHATHSGAQSHAFHGEADSTMARTVYADATSSTGATVGVLGRSRSSSGYGVLGQAIADSGLNYGVYGMTNSAGGFGGYFDGRGYFSGNVGIGTTAPGSPLTVNGLIESTADGFRFPDGTTQTSAAVSAAELWHQSGSSLYYNAGNVGIGTADPAATLDVVGGVRMEGFRLTDDPESGYVLTCDAQGNGSWQPPSAGGESLWQTNGSEIYYDTANVGVGVSDPQTTLHVAGGNWDVVHTEGDFKIGGGTYRLKMGVATDGVGAGHCRIFAGGPSSRLTLGANGSERLTVTPTNVEVTGGIVVDGFALTDSPVSGYVLTSDSAGNGSWQPGGGGGSFNLPLDRSVTIDGDAFRITNSGTSHATSAITGIIDNASSDAAAAHFSAIGSGMAIQASSDNTTTVYASNSGSGKAFYGSTNGSGGGDFRSAMDGGYGVRGTAASSGSSTQNRGGWFRAVNSPGGIGVEAEGQMVGVRAIGTKPNGVGLRAEATGVESNGVYATSPYKALVASSSYIAGAFYGSVRVYPYSGGSQIFAVNTDGTTQVDVLQIMGGADLSEQFDVDTGRTAAEPGMVVCIDPERAGKLVISSRAYDRTVAGIISGAGGIETGMMMGQQDTVADGAYPVALTGRVYVRANTTNAPILPGDLLTTSDMPGYAMKVTDYDRANGAIIGKAMTGLPAGDKGLVLVLVSLQ